MYGAEIIDTDHRTPHNDPPLKITMWWKEVFAEAATVSQEEVLLELANSEVYEPLASGEEVVGTIPYELLQLRIVYRKQNAAYLKVLREVRSRFPDIPNEEVDRQRKEAMQEALPMDASRLTRIPWYINHALKEEFHVPDHKTAEVRERGVVVLTNKPGRPKSTFAIG